MYSEGVIRTDVLELLTFAIAYWVARGLTCWTHTPDQALGAICEMLVTFQFDSSKTSMSIAFLATGKYMNIPEYVIHRFATLCANP